MKNLKLSAIALMTILSVAATSNVKASEDIKPKAGIDLKFIGNNENQPVFQLNVHNTEEDEFTVTFRDDQNNILYTGKLKGVSVTKNFQLNTEDGDGTLSVEVKSRKTNKSEVYKINKTVSYTQEIVVNKL